jgi:hypothetical protein
MKYKRTIKSLLWGIAGAVVSFSFIAIPQLKLAFGYPLLALSCLMFILSAYQFYQDNKKQITSTS